jgi:D-amino-acid dehydrogenase
MKFIKGYSISITLDAEDKVPDVGIADPANEIFYAKLGTHFRVAGLTEEVGMDISINPDKIAILLNAVNDIFPQLNVFAKDRAAKVHKWACLRPSSATRTPFISATKYKNLFINTGHGGYGWTLAPASAKYLTELLMNQDPIL